MSDRLPPEVFNNRVIILTLAFVIISMTVVMLVGLFVDKVDNKALFTILAPGFSAVLGYFIGRGDRMEPHK